MEVDIVGYHLDEPLAGTCKDCGKPAGFVIVSITGALNDFELCANCLDSGNYQIREDRVQSGFKHTADNIVNIFDWEKDKKKP